MADRADVDRQRAEQAAVSTRARAALDRFWGGLNLQDPQGSRDALVAFLPDLVASYGEAAAVVAADWYDDMRETAGAPHGFHAGLGDLVPDEAVVARARYGAQHLWTDNPDQTRRFLLGVVDQYVKQAARNTIVQAGRRDPWKPRFARVPRGAVTCGFCLMLASRGPVYLTQKTAGEFTKFHGLCDCQIVPIGPNDPLPDGYDPDALYGEYLAAGRDPAVMDEGRPRRSSPSPLVDAKGMTIPSFTDRAAWLQRQRALPVDFHGEEIEPHEVFFLERFLESDAHPLVEWIPRSPTRRPTNDFVWLDLGEIEVELKSPGADYDVIRARITRAVSRATAQGVVKENFIIDLGTTPFDADLAEALTRYNVDRSRNQIKRLWVFSGTDLVQIPLQ